MVLGSFAAIVVGAGFRMPFIGDVAARPAPTLLVLAWLAYGFIRTCRRSICTNTGMR